jgi:hypothetical protein
MRDADPQLLKAVRERDAERQARLRAERAAQALKLQNEQLRRRVAILTADKAKLPRTSQVARPPS